MAVFHNLSTNPGVIGGLGRDLHGAAVFLTRIPLPAAGGGGLARAAWAFPVVGAVVGGAGAGVLMGAAWLGLPPLVGALAAIGAMALLTGALHEDGLADTADGLGGGRTRADVLRIMHDSHIGAFGVLALILSVGLRAAALTGLPDANSAALALIAAAVVSRAALPALMRGLPPARTDGLAATAGRPGIVSVTAAAALAVVVAAVTLAPPAAAALAVAAVLGAAVVAVLAYRRIGGHTGDVLGAAQQVAEMAALIAVAAVA